MDSCGDARRGFPSTIEDDFRFAVIINVGQDRGTNEWIVVSDLRKQDVAVGIEDIDAAASVAVSGECHDFEDAVIVDVADGSRVLCHAAYEGLRPKDITLSVDDIDFLVVAENDFVSAIVVEVG